MKENEKITVYDLSDRYDGFYIWANTDGFLDEFTDCIISEEDGD